MEERIVPVKRVFTTAWKQPVLPFLRRLMIILTVMAVLMTTTKAQESIGDTQTSFSGSVYSESLTTLGPPSEEATTLVTKSLASNSFSSTPLLNEAQTTISITENLESTLIQSANSLSTDIHSTSVYNSFPTSAVTSTIPSIFSDSIFTNTADSVIDPSYNAGFESSDSQLSSRVDNALSNSQSSIEQPDSSVNSVDGSYVTDINPSVTLSLPVSMSASNPAVSALDSEMSPAISLPSLTGDAYSIQTTNISQSLSSSYTIRESDTSTVSKVVEAIGSTSVLGTEGSIAYTDLSDISLATESNVADSSVISVGGSYVTDISPSVTLSLPVSMSPSNPAVSALKSEMSSAISLPSLAGDTNSTHTTVSQSLSSSYTVRESDSLTDSKVTEATPSLIGSMNVLETEGSMTNTDLSDISLATESNVADSSVNSAGWSYVTDINPSVTLSLPVSMSASNPADSALKSEMSPAISLPSLAGDPNSTQTTVARSLSSSYMIRELDSLTDLKVPEATPSLIGSMNVLETEGSMAHTYLSDISLATERMETVSLSDSLDFSRQRITSQIPDELTSLTFVGTETTGFTPLLLQSSLSFSVAVTTSLYSYAGTTEDLKSGVLSSFDDTPSVFDPGPNDQVTTQQELLSTAVLIGSDGFRESGSIPAFEFSVTPVMDFSSQTSVVSSATSVLLTQESQISPTPTQASVSELNSTIIDLVQEVSGAISAVSESTVSVGTHSDSISSVQTGPVGLSSVDTSLLHLSVQSSVTDIGLSSVVPVGSAGLTSSLDYLGLTSVLDSVSISEVPTMQLNTSVLEEILSRSSQELESTLNLSDEVSFKPETLITSSETELDTSMNQSVEVSSMLTQSKLFEMSTDSTTLEVGMVESDASFFPSATDSSLVIRTFIQSDLDLNASSLHDTESSIDVSGISSMSVFDMSLYPLTLEVTPSLNTEIISVDLNLSFSSQTLSQSSLLGLSEIFNSMTSVQSSLFESMSASVPVAGVNDISDLQSMTASFTTNLDVLLSSSDVSDFSFTDSMTLSFSSNLSLVGTSSGSTTSDLEDRTQMFSSLSTIDSNFLFSLNVTDETQSLSFETYLRTITDSTVLEISQGSMQTLMQLSETQQSASSVYSRMVFNATEFPTSPTMEETTSILQETVVFSTSVSDTEGTQTVSSLELTNQSSSFSDLSPSLVLQVSSVNFSDAGFSVSQIPTVSNSEHLLSSVISPLYSDVFPGSLDSNSSPFSLATSSVFNDFSTASDDAFQASISASSMKESIESSSLVDFMNISSEVASVDPHNQTQSSIEETESYFYMSGNSILPLSPSTWQVSETTDQPIAASYTPLDVQETANVSISLESTQTYIMSEHPSETSQNFTDLIQTSVFSLSEVSVESDYSSIVTTLETLSDTFTANTTFASIAETPLTTSGNFTSDFLSESFETLPLTKSLSAPDFLSYTDSVETTPSQDVSSFLLSTVSPDVSSPSDMILSQNYSESSELLLPVSSSLNSTEMDTETSGSLNEAIESTVSQNFDTLPTVFYSLSSALSGFFSDDTFTSMSLSTLSVLSPSFSSVITGVDVNSSSDAKSLISYSGTISMSHFFASGLPDIAIQNTTNLFPSSDLFSSATHNSSDLFSLATQNATNVFSAELSDTSFQTDTLSTNDYNMTASVPQTTGVFGSDVFETASGLETFGISEDLNQTTLESTLMQSTPTFSEDLIENMTSAFIPIASEASPGVQTVPLFSEDFNQTSEGHTTPLSTSETSLFSQMISEVSKELNETESPLLTTPVFLSDTISEFSLDLNGTMTSVSSTSLFTSDALTPLSQTISDFPVGLNDTTQTSPPIFINETSSVALSASEVSEEFNETSASILSTSLFPSDIFPISHTMSDFPIDFNETSQTLPPGIVNETSSVIPTHSEFSIDLNETQLMSDITPVFTIETASLTLSMSEFMPGFNETTETPSSIFINGTASVVATESEFSVDFNETIYILSESSSQLASSAPSMSKFSLNVNQTESTFDVTPSYTSDTASDSSTSDFSIDVNDTVSLVYTPLVFTSETASLEASPSELSIDSTQQSSVIQPTSAILADLNQTSLLTTLFIDELNATATASPLPLFSENVNETSVLTPSEVFYANFSSTLETYSTTQDLSFSTQSTPFDISSDLPSNTSSPNASFSSPVLPSEILTTDIASNTSFSTPTLLSDVSTDMLMNVSSLDFEPSVIMSTTSASFPGDVTAFSSQVDTLTPLFQSSSTLEESLSTLQDSVPVQTLNLSEAIAPSTSTPDLISLMSSSFSAPSDSLESHLSLLPSSPESPAFFSPEVTPSMTVSDNSSSSEFFENSTSQIFASLTDTVFPSEDFQSTFSANETIESPESPASFSPEVTPSMTLSVNSSSSEFFENSTSQIFASLTDTVFPSEDLQSTFSANETIESTPQLASFSLNINETVTKDIELTADITSTLFSDLSTSLLTSISEPNVSDTVIVSLDVSVENMTATPSTVQDTVEISTPIFSISDQLNVSETLDFNSTLSSTESTPSTLTSFETSTILFSSGSDFNLSETDMFPFISTSLASDSLRPLTTTFFTSDLVLNVSETISLSFNTVGSSSPLEEITAQVSSLFDFNTSSTFDTSFPTLSRPTEASSSFEGSFFSSSLIVSPTTANLSEAVETKSVHDTLIILSTFETASDISTPSFSSVTYSRLSEIVSSEYLSQSVSTPTALVSLEVSSPESIDTLQPTIILSESAQTTIDLDQSSIIGTTGTISPSLMASSELSQEISVSTTKLPSSSIIPTSTPAVTTPPPTTTTTQQPDSTVSNIQNKRNNTEFWVVLTLLVRPDVDVSTQAFQAPIEKGLANSYYFARLRQQEIADGTFVPLLTRRRKRLASADGSASTKVDIVEVNRKDGTTEVDIVHVVEEEGEILTATIATEQMTLLSDQEVAIKTGHVVKFNAKPYNEPPAEEDDDDDTVMWIIIGGVLGCLVLIIIIIIVLVWCCCGWPCCRKKEEEPVKVTDLQEEGLVKVPEVGEPSGAYVEEDAAKGSMSLAFVNPRRGKYEVKADPEEEDPLYATVEKKTPPTKAPRKKKSSHQTQEATVENEMGRYDDEPVMDTPQRRKKKKRRNAEQDENDIRSVYESQIASLAESSEQPMRYTQASYTLSSQPTVEDEGDLLDNAEEERKKNKQRLRAKKVKEQLHSSPVKSAEPVDLAYENANKEIDKVLGPRETEEEERRRRHKEKSRKKREKSKKKGEDNEAYSSDEKKEVETLQEAREKMHKLLDDAFSLISQSKSSMGNKVDPSRQSSDEKSTPRSSGSKNSPRDDNWVEAERDKPEKKHTPIHVHRSHEPYDSSGLVSWSPYRASDDTALISLPNTQTNLSTSPPQQEKITTSVFTENLPGSYYATQPGEPIVIKSKNLDSSKPPSGTQSRRSSHNGDGQRHPNRTSSNNVGHSTFQNPLYDNTLPMRSTDRFSDPYHGMSSYQEIPLSTPIPGQADNGSPLKNGNISGRSHDQLGHSTPSSVYPRENGTSVIDVRGHTAPQKGENKNYDVVDAITQSVQPGASPQPLINSLREELQTLSSKRMVGTNSLGSQKTGSQSLSGSNTLGSQKPEKKPETLLFKARTYGLQDSASGWETMPGNSTSDV